jgi:hypothetical protein
MQFQNMFWSLFGSQVKPYEVQIPMVEGQSVEVPFNQLSYFRGTTTYTLHLGESPWSSIWASISITRLCGRRKNVVARRRCEI